MTYGTTFKEALKATHTKRSDIAEETHYSHQSVTAWANDTRTISAEALPKVASKLDYPDLYLESAVKATNGVAIPLLDGDYITRSPTGMKELVEYETREALDKLEHTRMLKPAVFATEVDKEDMKQVIYESLDAACSMVNMIAVLCKEYDISMRETYKKWFATLKERRMRK